MVIREAPVDVALESTRGGTQRLSAFRGRVVVLLWEDRAHQVENPILKEELSRLAAERVRDVAVLAVGDVSAYDFAGARSIVRTAVSTIARAIGVEILLDWRGELGAPPFGLTKGESNVMVIDREGRPVFRRTGSLRETEQRAIVDLARAMTAMPEGAMVAPDVLSIEGLPIDGVRAA